MPDPAIGGVPFQEAIDHFRGKLNIPTRHFDDLMGDIHARAFTVAGATKLDLLTDIRSAVDDAITSGTTIADFRKQFDVAVKKHGWSYKGKRGWRTRVIYDTNLRTAHMAGKWEQFQRVKDTRPFLQYQTVGDRRVRPEHAAWDNKVLHIDDPWWDTHMPPNDYGCRCTARSLSARQMKRDKLELGEAPPLEKSERINTRTGEVYGKVPKGIGAGWDYNVGKAWLGPQASFGQKLAALPPRIRESALSPAALATVSSIVSPVFAKWAKAVLDGERIGHVQHVGYLSNRAIEFAAAKGVDINDATISILANDLKGMRIEKTARSSGRNRVKPAKILIPIDDLVALPDRLVTAAVLWDVESKSLVYAFDSPAIDKTSKIIAKQRQNKGIARNLVIHGSVTPTASLRVEKKYILIEGKL
jgi:SPP1 gp7 family putative phage head morphogenesis protein